MTKKIVDMKMFISASDDVQIGPFQSTHFKLSLSIINDHDMKTYMGA